MLSWCSGLRYIDYPKGCPRKIKHVYFMGQHSPGCMPQPFGARPLGALDVVEVRSPENIAMARGNVMGK